MMLFKLSIKNMKKSIKDYAIYFLTLVLGVAIFYMFNSLDSQQAMLQVSESTRTTIQLMISVLGYVSVFVAVILGLLIVYANNFLINRRKKEFGIYMTLGMDKKQISKIILIETVLVGIVSLVVGLIIGIFASQFMSILVAKMFDANMSKFQFIFSKDACIKTCIYFAVMYVAVMVFNTFTVSRYKLINLLNSNRKNEKVKIKNPIISIIIFIIASTILGYAYWRVTKDVSNIQNEIDLLYPILLGIIGTVLVFWSLSGFVLKIVQSIKGIYLKGTNMFVLRQLNNKINTTVISMSVICLMLFMTITILSSALSLKNTLQKEVNEVTTVDVNLTKTANLPESYTTKNGEVFDYTEEQIEDSRTTVFETLKNNGVDMSLLKDIVEIPVYATNEWTWHDSFGSYYDEANKEYSMLLYNTPEDLVKISDYNKIASLYGLEQYELKDDEFVVVCDYSNMVEMRNNGLKFGSNTVTLNGVIYKSKYDECKKGFIQISSNHTNMGIIVVPDNAPLTEDMKYETLLAANYNAKTNEQKADIEEKYFGETGTVQKIIDNGMQINCVTRSALLDSTIGLSAIVTFIAIYLGIIFLIASAAILALKQLTESSDNIQRYTILRKIGCDEKMINKALFRQIGIFFGLPLVLAIIHSIFGIKFGLIMMSGLASKDELLPSIIATIIIMGGIYGAYFLATYFGSKNIIKE